MEKASICLVFLESSRGFGNGTSTVLDLMRRPGGASVNLNETHAITYPVKCRCTSQFYLYIAVAGVAKSDFSQEVRFD